MADLNFENCAEPASRTLSPECSQPVGAATTPNPVQAEGRHRSSLEPTPPTGRPNRNRPRLNYAKLDNGDWAAEAKKSTGSSETVRGNRKRLKFDREFEEREREGEIKKQIEREKRRARDKRRNERLLAEQVGNGGEQDYNYLGTATSGHTSGFGTEKANLTTTTTRAGYYRPLLPATFQQSPPCGTPQAGTFAEASSNPRSLSTPYPTKPPKSAPKSTNHRDKTTNSLGTRPASTMPARRHNYRPPPSSSPSSSPTTSPRPDQLAYEESYAAIRAPATGARNTFIIWSRELIQSELLTFRRIVSTPSPTIQTLLLTRHRIQGSLHERARIYIQRSPGGAADVCAHIVCGRKFDKDQLRVSFEPLVWTQPVGTFGKHATKNMVVVLDKEFQIPQSQPGNYGEVKGTVELGVPEYKVLKAVEMRREYGEGCFACLHCFENLIEEEGVDVPPEDSKGMKAWLKGKIGEGKRPSAWCRVYSSVWPETRVDGKGRYRLAKGEIEIVVKWKKALFRKGMRKLSEKWGMELSEEEEEEAEEGGFVWEDGMGVAEALRITGASKH